MVKYGVHKTTWGPYFSPKDLESFFDQARQAGAEAVEFRPTDEMLEYDLDKIRETRKLAEKYGVEMVFTYGFPKYLDMRSEDPFIREYATDFLIRGIRCVSAVGGTSIGSAGIYACWPARYDHDMISGQEKYERTQRSLECVRKAVKVAEQYGICLNLEVVNRFENYLINTAEEGAAYCDEVDSPNCGLLLDLFHMNIEETDICEAIRRVGKRIGHFHVSEPNRAIPNRNYHRIDWKSIGEALRETGYRKAVVIEACCGCDGTASYPMRIWRDLQEDTSLEGRMKALSEGLAFIRQEMGL